LEILVAYDAAADGEKGALLRREGPPEPPKLPSGSWINKPDDTEEATQ
jgi:hypothetical protein